MALDGILQRFLYTNIDCMYHDLLIMEAFLIRVLNNSNIVSKLIFQLTRLSVHPYVRPSVRP